ncbi:unnamed protein product [Thlaspi arvense]|uniref:Nudix hydrolase domain-containing protein n=1 Tax=Thlaspi arvense TaxID=13288 RepID=A0AAU9SJI7_THLAR|nr:unnamed protein product [Thlaspi arvense]
MAKVAEVKVMIPEGSRYELLLSCPSGLSLSQVSVDFSKSHDRIPHSDPGLEDSIAQVREWFLILELNSIMLDRIVKISSEMAKILSLILQCELANLIGSHLSFPLMLVLDNLGLGAENTGEFITVQWPKIQIGDGDEVPQVCLRLGLTDYRTFVGTNLSSLWERFLVTSQDDDSVRCRHTSSPLGNGAVLETSDKKIIVLRRSNNVGEFPGHYVFPGGHPEPMSVGIDSHQLEKDGEVLNKKVTQEMFESITREVVEETGIPASSLSPPLFIGISRRELNVRPAMFFFIKCSHHSDDIQRLYPDAEDGFESTQLHTVSMDELKTMTSRMPGCHHGGFALYELMLQRVQ